ncbi:MAG: PAS domain S-box protein, partial [Cyanobacteria bacterium P01_A01_bin.80]
MQSNAEQIDLLTLDRVVNTTPLIVTPETLVINAIALMANQLPDSNCCSPSLHHERTEPFLTGVPRSSLSDCSKAASSIKNRHADCVLVIKDFELLGILTPSDVVRITFLKGDLTKIKIAEVMTQQVISLKESDNYNIFSALQIMRQHEIHHLPIVDAQEHVVGIVSQDSLLQALDLQSLMAGTSLPSLQHQNVVLETNREYQEYENIDRNITESQQIEDKLRESKERFRLLVTHVPVGIFQTDAEGGCLFVNPRWVEITGISQEEALGKGWVEALHPEDKQQVFTQWYDAATAGREFTMKYRFRTPGGKVSWVFGNAVAIRDRARVITGYLGTVTDITELKLAEEQLRWTEASLQEAQRIAKMGSWSRDLTTNEIWWSQQFYRIINLNPGDAMPDMETIINTIVHPEDQNRIYQMVMACVEQGIPYETEIRFLRPDDSVGYLFIYGTVERDSQGNLRRYYGIVQDISEYKQVELELRESKKRYCSVVKSIHEGVVIQQADGTIISCNASAEKILGLSAEQIKGGNFLDPRWHAIHEDGSPFTGETHPPMIALHTGESCSDTVMGIYQPDGELNWILMNSEPLFLPGETIPHAVVTSFSDITRRKEAEEKIVEQAQLLDITTDAILVTNLEDIVIYCNRSVEKIYGWTKQEMIGQKANNILYKKLTSEFEQAMGEVLENGSWSGELDKVTKAGKNIIVSSRWTLVRDEAGNPESILSLDTDITEKKQLENQFLRTQRLENLGTLASGIAHDLNNMLTPILAIAQLIPLKLKSPDKDCSDLLVMLENSARRGANLVKQILTFARGNEGKRTVLQIKHLLKDIELFAKGTFSKSITIQTNLSQDLLTVSADPTQIYQVLMNLVVNAGDAMPNGGKITISAQNLYVDEGYAKMNIEARVGDYVVVTISDTGTGISP